MDEHRDESKSVLTFACPHCGGPLHVTDDGGVACEERHRFTVAEVSLEQSRVTAKAAWHAVRTLEERAQAARWAQRDPDLYDVGDHDSLERQARADEDLAGILRRHAQALDLTLWRLSRNRDAPTD